MRYCPTPCSRWREHGKANNPRPRVRAGGSTRGGWVPTSGRSLLRRDLDQAANLDASDRPALAHAGRLNQHVRDIADGDAPLNEFIVADVVLTLLLEVVRDHHRVRGD